MNIFERISYRLKGYRTWIVNGLMAVMPLLEAAELVAIIPNEWYKYYAFIIVVINFGLRKITTSPLGKKL